MKILIAIVTLAISTSCTDSSRSTDNSNISDTKVWAINLKRAKIDLTFALHSEFDTLLIWKESSCQCNSFKYRVQSKNVPIYFDGCCADDKVPLNKLQLTIEESLDSVDITIPFTNEWIVKTHQQQVQYSRNDPQTQQTQYDTLLYLQNSVYSIFTNISKYVKQGIFKQTLTTTIYPKGIPVRLTFERSYTKIPLDRTLFINDCIATIKSLTVSNGT